MLRSLSDVQAEFAAALLDPAQPPPAGLVGPDGGPAPRRFAVYRNNVIVGLSNAVADSFPAVERIVGRDFFRVMVRTYVLANPPRSPVLMNYGADFPRFIATFAPAASLPYLPDVARIERAWREAYHAADAEPLDAAALARLGGEDPGAMVLTLHPSVRIVRSRYPALAIWKMNVGDAKPGPVDFSISEDALIVRPDAEVDVRVVPPGGAVFIAALGRGASLGAAAEEAAAADDRFDLAGNIAGLVAAGAFRGTGR